MPPNGFNPFDLVEDFKKSGFPQKQAESLARALTDVESKNAATKQDLEITKLELKRDIAELKKDIEGVKAELKRDIAVLKKDMVIIMGGYAVFILGTLVTLAKLGLLSP